MKQLTQEGAIEKAKRSHGDLYDLSLLVYTKCQSNVLVGCSKHGTFSICFRDFTARDKPGGCQICSKEKYALTRDDSHNKISESEALKRMTDSHGSKFDYSQMSFTAYAEKVDIICPAHGKFSMSPQLHVISLHGCQNCSDTAGAVARYTSRDESIGRAKVLFGDTYDYSGVPEGICSKTKFEIICKVHGKFTKSWNEHLAGSGCKVCSRAALGNRYRSNAEEFIAKAREVHGDTFDYSAVDYKSSKDYVEITCKTHGSFMQKPNKHLSGRGCNACAENGYRIAKAGHLYVFKSNDITKIGITNRPVSTRLSEINQSGKNFSCVYKQKYKCGEACLNAETALLRYLGNLYLPCGDKFHGSTECFMDVNLEDIVMMIEETVEV